MAAIVTKLYVNLSSYITSYNVCIAMSSHPNVSYCVAIRYTRILKGGMQVGQLTSLGLQQCYDLGLRLRDKYVLKHRLLYATVGLMSVCLTVRVFMAAPPCH